MAIRGDTLSISVKTSDLDVNTESGPYPPVIVIGMHRSGTTLVVKMLEALKFFAGWRQDANHEAIFFQHINAWLAAEAGCTWEHPDPIHDLLAHPAATQERAAYIAERLLPARRNRLFLGSARRRYRVPAALLQPWGWKDPLNTYTLPVWCSIFPDARVLHIERHGVDVAESLRVRNGREMRRRARQSLNRLHWFNWLKPRRPGFPASGRCATLSGAFSLWEEYVDEARRQVASLGAQAMDVRYEVLLSSPQRELRRIADFCGLNASSESCARAATCADVARAYAYRSHPELRDFAAFVAPALSRRGYAA